jgi:hypothetical protein
MNQKTKTQNRIEVEKLLDKSFNPKINCVRFGQGETLRHALAKFLVCYELSQNNNEYITEARLSSGGRCDVISLSEFMVYEILETENDNNNKTYPIPITKLRADKVIKHYKKTLIGDEK